MTRSLSDRLGRRGASAFEFALVSPVLLAMVFGMMDYGWYFSQEALVTSALDAAVRAGANVVPEFDEGPGECAMCIEATRQYAQDALGKVGVSATLSEVTPTIQNVNGTCALILQPTLPHAELIGLVTVPDAYRVQTIAMAMNVSGC